MTKVEIDQARSDIEATADLLERAMKLSGLISTLFARRGFPLVVVGGSAVEFYTEGGYMSGDIDFCRKTLKSVPPRQMMASALADVLFDWAEAERLAALPDFKVAEQLSELKQEVARG